MSDPIIFISRNRIKDGALDEFLEHYQASIPVTRANKPNTLIQLAYFDESAGQLVIVRLFPDAAALDQQLQGADTRSRSAYQFIEPTSVEIYGHPNAYALDMIEKVASQGIDVKIFPYFLEFRLI
jgi:quinol monooxygenase YgiN